MTYILYKKSTCEPCAGTGWYLERFLSKPLKFTCKACSGQGHTLAEVDLLDALNDDGLTEIACDCGREHWGRAAGINGTMLEWKCGGELKRDTNA